MFDYEIKEQDGAPIHIEGIGTLTKEAKYENPGFTRWQTWDSMPNPTLTGKATVSTPPYLVIFANWAWANDWAFDYDEYDPNRAFYTEGENSSPDSDSCGLLYWDLQNVAPGSNKAIVTYYGTGEPVSPVPPREKLIESIEDLTHAMYVTMSYYASDVADVNAKTYKKLHKDGLLEVAKFVFDTAHGSFAQLPPSLVPSARMLRDVGYFSRAEKMALSVGKELLVDDIPDNASESQVSDYYFSTFMGDREGQEAFPYFPDPYYPTDESKDRPGITDLEFRMAEFESEIINKLPDPLPPGYPTDEVIKVINEFTDSVEEARTREVKIVWMTPDGPWCKVGSLVLPTKIQAYNELYEDVDLVDRVEDYSFYACAGLAAAGLGAKGAAFLTLIFPPAVAVAPVLYSAGQAIITTSAGVCTLVRPITSFAEVVPFNALEIANAAITLQLVEHISLMIQAYSDTLNYVDQGTHDSQGSLHVLSLSAHSIEVIDVETPDIVLDDEELAGSQVGTIRVRNTGSEPAHITAYAIIYGPKINGEICSTGLSYQRELLVLAGGETGDLTFTYSAIRSSVLGCDKYVADIYVFDGLNAIGPLMSCFYAGTEGQCDIYREQSVYTPLAGSLTEGQSQQTTIDTSPATVTTELTLSYSGSDVDLHVYDLEGRHVGVNYFTGEVEVEIPNAAYSGPASYPELIELGNSSAEEYTIEVVCVSGSENVTFSVAATETPIRPAMMDIIPPVIEVSAYAGEIIANTFLVSEIGGQKNITGLNISATDLVDGEGHTIPSSNLAFDIPATEIPAGSSVPIVVVVNTPGDALLGAYTGKIIATDNSGATDESTLNVTVVAQIVGETREVNCAILPGVTVCLYQHDVEIACTVSNGTGNFELAVPELGDYVVIASKDGFRNKTQAILINETKTYTLDFVGDYGLIPNAPNMSYVLACVNLWKFGTPPYQLNMSTVLAVINAWKFPI